MRNLESRQNNPCLTILSCVCLGNLLLYIAFSNLQTVYMRQKDYVGQSSSKSRLEVRSDDKRKDLFDEKFTVNEPFVCTNETVDLIIVVCSSVENFSQRNAIRKTWGSYTKGIFNVKLIFLLGIWRKNRFSRVKTPLMKEITEHRDIVQGNFIDSYRNLTLKSIYMLDWIQNYCSNAKFVLKSDDDMYINIPNLFHALNTQLMPEFLMGNLIVGAKPSQDRTSKWYTPKSEFKDIMYPPYLSGTAYVISGSAISKLYNASITKKQFWLEDVFITGMCAKVSGLYHINRNDMTFNTPKPYGCTLKRLISGHRIKWQNMRKIHQGVLNNDSNFCNKNYFAN